MSQTTQTNDFIAALKGLRQSRRFLDQPVPPEIVHDLLEVARWTGSSKNGQSWQFIVVDDRATNTALSEAGAFTQFLNNVAVSIVITLDGTGPRAEAYDEGRVSERLMLAADHHGLGSGTAWFSTPDAQDKVRQLLGIPADRHVWSAVGFGYVDTSAPQRATSVGGGRKPLAEIVSYGHYGERSRG
ncbi:MAG: nitroreductase family protein [Chloroflexota bacterium]|nr:nitroreductase family protein [Chloroflexota bacterium]